MDSSTEKILHLLQIAQQHGLELELIASANIHHEAFPKASLLECFQVAADEWDL